MVALSGCAVPSQSPTPSPSASRLSVASAPPSLLPSIAPGSIGSGVGVDWTTVATYPGTRVNDVTAGGPGWVAVGTEGPLLCMGECLLEQFSGRIWSSADGRSWDEVTVSDWPLGSVTAGPGGLVAIGSGQTRPVVLFSADGATWVDAEATFPQGTDIADLVGGSIYVAVGSEWSDANQTRRPAIWTSTSGRDWREVLGSTDVGAVQKVTLGRRGWAAVGYIDPADGAMPPNVPFEPTAWVAEDSLAWTAYDLPLDGHASGGWADAVLDTGPGLVVAGFEEFPSTTESQFGFATWLSPDGIDWEANPVSPGKLESLVIRRVLYEAGERLFAIGTFAPGADLQDPGLWWTTEDGATWTSHVEAPPEIYAVVPFGSGLLGVGIENGEGAIFVSE